MQTTTETPDQTPPAEVEKARLVTVDVGTAASSSAIFQAEPALIVQSSQDETQSAWISYNVERHRRRVENFRYNRPQLESGSNL
jgi:hypothetical protein